MKRAPTFSQLTDAYLFQEVLDRANIFQKKHPHVEILSLGVGDTTEPLIPQVTERLTTFSSAMGERKTYRGYGPEQGLVELRKEIASVLYNNRYSHDEIFISDGAKCDISRLIQLLTYNGSVAIQDPTYPCYVEISALCAQASITYLTGIPDLSQAPRSSLIFLCNPNNPTGTAFTYEQLETMVNTARERKQLIMIDVAYRSFIQDDLPRSIYEIPGADQVAIEIGSFSKMAGFSSVRLGWTVVPHALVYDDGSSVHEDVLRLYNSLFNGAPILSQEAAIAALSPNGRKALQKQTESYLQRTRQLREALTPRFPSVQGGTHCPYLWVRTEQTSSWEAFDYFLEKAHLIVMPGIGFGPGGEGFVRVSGFPRQEIIDKACRNIETL